MSEAPGVGPDQGKPEAFRFMSRKALDQLVEARVEIAMAEYLASLDAPAIWESIKKHDKALFGNGRPGLVEEMAVIRPMAPKLEAHLKAFNDFETQTKLDRQSFFGRFDTIEKKVDDGLAALTEAIKPFTKISSVILKGGVAIGFFAFLAGGLVAFALGHIDRLSEIMQWLMKSK